MLFAVALDALVGWPQWLYERIGHPVTWIGRTITFVDRVLNVSGASSLALKSRGIGAWIAVVSAAVVPAFLLQNTLPADGPLRVMIIGFLAWPFVAARSLYAHVAAVAEPLERNELRGARKAVAMIVGRDTTNLDEAGISRAAIESLAENASDGVVAPLFWGVLFGLPGIAGYKAVNTLDSMIGHKTPRHEAFGWASAKIDDAANYLPARLTAALLAAVSGRPVAVLRSTLANAKFHRSPNAGWPEAAMASILGLRLSGPRIYHDRVAGEPWLNESGADASASDIRRALRVYLFAMALLAAIGAAGVVTSRT
ncbi:MAG: cobalamin biosynthesis protein CobD [Hyphomicrobium sp.]|nr:cobalamin biosynthesis protein CobD [Hyphomicrobium sp.]